MKTALLAFVFLLLACTSGHAQTILALEPPSYGAGNGPFLLIVDGTGGLTTCNVVYDGVELTSIAISDRKISATIPNQTIVGPHQVASHCPSGYTTPIFIFTVTSGVAVVTSWTPRIFHAGQDTSGTITGTGFASNAVAFFDGQAISTIFVNTTTLQIFVPGGLITRSGPDHFFRVQNVPFVPPPPTNPAVGFSSSLMAFGNVQQSTTSSPIVVILTSTGTANLVISSLTVTGGSNPSDFSLGGSCAPGSYPPTATCTLSSQFTPSTSGAETSSISVADNVAGSPQAISLTGTGVVAGAHHVDLTWTASSSGSLLGYNIYSSTTNGGPYTKLNGSPVGGLSYTDSTVLSSTTYYYVATAVGDSSYGIPESVISNQYTAVIP